MGNVLRGTLVNPDVIYGKSAYEIAVKLGKTDGTEEEWIDAITEEAKSARDEAKASAESVQASVFDAEQSAIAASNHEAASREFAKDAERAATQATEAVENAIGSIEQAKQDALDDIGDMGLVQTTGDSENAVMSQKATTEAIAKTNNSAWYNMYDKLSQTTLGSGGHVNMLYTMPERRMPWLIDASGSSDITDGPLKTTADAYDFTDYIKCSKYLFANSKSTSDRIIIYFYRKTEDGYELRWDIIKQNTGSGVRNYVGKGELGKLIELPDDNCYVRVCKVVGNIELYTWDGEACGVSLNAGIDYIASDGSIAVSTPNNRYITVVPSNTRLLFTDNSLRILTIFGLDENADFTPWKPEDLNGDGKVDESDFILSPPSDTINYQTYHQCFDFTGHKRSPIDGHKYYSYMVVLEWRPPETTDTSKVLYNELGNHLVCITDEMCQERVVGDSKKLLENALIVNNLQWTPTKDIILRELNADTDASIELVYRGGTTYHGIPYGGKWDAPHFVGWHVSPRTFVNAMNDENSVLYNEKVSHSNGKANAPYYGVVCSAYVTMICGFPCINTNAGFIYSPDIVNGFYDNAPLGIIWSDKGHCVVPVVKYHAKDMSIVRIAESLKPLSSITTRYTDVKKEKNAFSHYNGFSYLDEMFYTARHKRQTCKMSDVPYANFEDVTIVNGTARPYKGDRSVYTSAEDTVKINLHGEGITKLYLQTPTKGTLNISCSGTSVDVKSHLTESGIYHVWTNISDTSKAFKESFEYRIVEPIEVTLGADYKSIAFSRNDFWYALCEVGGNDLLDRGAEIACVEGKTNGDYSGWFANDQMIEECQAVFYKGEYGAYIVPVKVNGVLVHDGKVVK